MTTASTVNSLQSVSVIVFPEGFNWPMDKGYFARGGIEVVLTPTPNSVFQLTNLNDGKFDIAMTAIDNVIAYMEGQGEAPTVSGSEPECVISDPEKKFSLINEEPFILTMVEVQRKPAFRLPTYLALKITPMANRRNPSKPSAHSLLIALPLLTEPSLQLLFFPEDKAINQREMNSGRETRRW